MEIALKKTQREKAVAKKRQRKMKFCEAFILRIKGHRGICILRERWGRERRKEGLEGSEMKGKEKKRKGREGEE